MTNNEPSSKVKIRFSDCDPLGHLNNAKYIEYMLNAREDHVVDRYGFTYEEYSKKTGCTWVTIQHEIAYLKELKYNMEVIISSKVIAVTDRISTVELIMKEEKTGKVNAVLWMSVIHFDLKTRRSAVLLPEYQQLFQDSLYEVEEKSFAERVSKFRQYNKSK